MTVTLLFYYSFILLTCSLSALFTQHFRNFIKQSTDEITLSQLERPELQKNGSYGGREDETDQLKHQPVILVHGVMSTVMTMYPVKHFFMSKNYSEAEIYGSTWGNPDELLIDVYLKCEYIQQIRSFIKIVHEYAQKKVDVIGYSIGVPITRKAILGGQCGKKNLGRPLTKLVDTFVSVGGPNYGSTLCDEYSYFDICNSNNGLAINSTFLAQLNKPRKRYEGAFSFAIGSFLDERVGNKCGVRQCASLKNSNQEFWGYRFIHDRLLTGSSALQHELVTAHKRVKAPLRANMPNNVRLPNFAYNSSIIWEDDPEFKKQLLESPVQKPEFDDKLKISESGHVEIPAAILEQLKHGGSGLNFEIPHFTQKSPQFEDFGDDTANSYKEYEDLVSQNLIEEKQRERTTRRPAPSAVSFINEDIFLTPKPRKNLVVHFSDAGRNDVIENLISQRNSLMRKISAQSKVPKAKKRITLTINSLLAMDDNHNGKKNIPLYKNNGVEPEDKFYIGKVDGEIRRIKKNDLYVKYNDCKWFF